MTLAGEPATFAEHRGGRIDRVDTCDARSHPTRDGTGAGAEVEHDRAVAVDETRE